MGRFGAVIALCTTTTTKYLKTSVPPDVFFLPFFFPLHSHHHHHQPSLLYLILLKPFLTFIEVNIRVEGAEENHGRVLNSAGKMNQRQREFVLMDFV